MTDATATIAAAAATIATATAAVTAAVASLAPPAAAPPAAAPPATAPPAATSTTTDQKVPDEKEYNRGRIIGYLERVMFFFFILQGQYTVLGFVISAKTIARFKDLDDRNFAEYFMVGTMLSVAIAGGVGLLIKFLCPL